MYDPNNLSALTYANGFTLWHYKSSDPLKDIIQDGYFNDAASMIRVGDFIFTNAAIHQFTESTTLICHSKDGGLDGASVTMEDMGSIIIETKRPVEVHEVVSEAHLKAPIPAPAGGIPLPSYRLDPLPGRMDLSLNQYLLLAIKNNENKKVRLGVEYLALALAGEAGEIANEIKKHWRENDGELVWNFGRDGSRRERMKLELGDALWYWAQLCRFCGFTPEEVALANISKLSSAPKS